MSRIVTVEVIRIEIGAIGERAVRDIEGQDNIAMSRKRLAVSEIGIIGIHHRPAAAAVTVDGEQGRILAAGWGGDGNGEIAVA